MVNSAVSAQTHVHFGSYYKMSKLKSLYLHFTFKNNKSTPASVPWRYHSDNCVAWRNRTLLILQHMSHDMIKPKKTWLAPAKIQISLGIRPVWSESSLCAQWVAKDPVLLHADSEDSDRTGRMPRLFWVFVWRSAILLVLSGRGSYDFKPAYSASETS